MGQGAWGMVLDAWGIQKSSQTFNPSALQSFSTLIPQSFKPSILQSMYLLPNYFLTTGFPLDP